VVGRITRQKDIETALRGFTDFHSRCADGELELHIIGPDSDAIYADQVRRLATELRCPAQFRGAVASPLSRGEIDVLVHSAVGEAAPLVLLEAAAHQVPIVCTTASLEWNWLGDRCRSFPARDWRALSDALLDTVENWDTAVRKASAAWEIVPDIQDTTAAYERLMSALVEERQRRRQGSHG
jgi:glycosyltransferase involved in cell wall biosynthesis